MRTRPPDTRRLPPAALVGSVPETVPVAAVAKAPEPAVAVAAVAPAPAAPLEPVQAPVGSSGWMAKRLQDLEAQAALHQFDGMMQALRLALRRLDTADEAGALAMLEGTPHAT